MDSLDQNSKSIAIAAYITPVGWLIALLTKSVCDCSTPFAIFHLRQGLGLNVVFLLGHFVLSLLDVYILTQIFDLLIIIAIIFCVLRANDRKMIPLPLLGEYFNRKFTFIQ